MTQKVEIHEFSPEMMTRLVALFGTYFAPDDRLLSAEYNSWLYLDNPFGVAKAVTVSENGEWIGFMALVPLELQRSTGILSAYFVVNVLVHPLHHGKNIFGRMIGAARDYARDRDCALMGHPNDMALKSWQRAGMNFLSPLRVSWPAPSPWARAIKRRVVRSLDSSDPLWQTLELQRKAATGWQVRVSPDFLTWRFLQHPTNSYQLELLETDGVSIGIRILKEMRHGIRILVDSFVLSSYERRGLRGLPWRTLAMRPRNNGAVDSRGFLFLPLKKQIPFFLTYDAAPIGFDEVADIGLTGSDF